MLRLCEFMFKPHAVLLLVCLGGGTRWGSCDGDVESLPDDLMSHLSSLQRYFCGSCSGSWQPCNPNVSKRCPFCQQICQPIERGEDTVDAECYQETCSADGSSCDGDPECDVCHFDDAHVCEFDNDDICVYADDGSNRSYCSCEDISGVVLDKSCGKRREELLTSTPTIQPPSPRVNVEALTLGIILVMFVAAAFLLVVCFCPKSKLMCKGRSSGNNAAADEGRRRSDGHNNGPTALEAYAVKEFNRTEKTNPVYGIALPMDHDQSNSGLKGDDVITLVQERGDQTHDGQRAAPSATPIDEWATGSHEGRIDLDSEREMLPIGPRHDPQDPAEGFMQESGVSSARKSGYQVGGDLGSAKDGSPSSQNVGNYLTLEQPFGNRNNDDTTKTASAIGNSESEAYDHVQRPRAQESKGSNYAHLDSQPEYDHFSRPGKIQTKEGAAGQHDTDNVYNRLESVDKK